MYALYKVSDYIITCILTRIDLIFIVQCWHACYIRLEGKFCAAHVLTSGTLYPVVYATKLPACKVIDPVPKL